MEQFEIHTAIGWNVNLQQKWEELFYPSLVKKLQQSNEKFSEQFRVDVLPLTEELFLTLYYPLYSSQIASRKAYIFSPEDMKNKMIKRINSKNYFLMAFYIKETDSFCGGILFSVDETNTLSVSLRVFDRDINKKYKFRTTIDFWGDKCLVEYSQQKGIQFMNHGKDHFPNYRGFGLPLFKLKVGGKPRISKKPEEVIILSKEEIVKGEIPAFFFDSPDSENIFHRSHFFYKKGSFDENAVNELISVCKWSGIECFLYELP